MPSIETQLPTEYPDNPAISQREIFLGMEEDARELAAVIGISDEAQQGYLDDATMFRRIAGEQTTDEMRLERFDIPLPENHPAKPVEQELGFAALNTLSS